MSCININEEMLYSINAALKANIHIFEALSIQRLIVAMSNVGKKNITFIEKGKKAEKADIWKDFKLYSKNDVKKLFSISEAEDCILMQHSWLYEDDCFVIIIVLKEKAVSIIERFFFIFLKILADFITHKSNDYKTIEEINNDWKKFFQNAVDKCIDINLVNSLSMATYEKQANQGSIIFTNDDNDIIPIAAFEKAIGYSNNNSRLIRKIVEMSNDIFPIIVCNREVLGLGSIKNNFPYIQFKGRLTWDLILSNQKFHYRNANFVFEDNMDKEDIEKEYFSELPNGFINENNNRLLQDIITKLKQQSHGTMLVIIKDKRVTESESNRLSNNGRGYKFNPKIEPKNKKYWELLLRFSSIDGAIIMDSDFNCYGCGFILDGKVESSGDPARGARFNSAWCYWENDKEKNTAIFVFSEDGTIDVVPPKVIKRVR